MLVGFDTCDDAGVYRISDDLALVQTVDFFTPIVDDPFTFGAIAAANSLSDVYAMGGTPICSLSILAYPAKGEMDVLGEVLRGGAQKMSEAECAIVGGHSVADDEIKFGYAVTGTVHPTRILANAGARPGDAVVLTKPVGTGVISTALKQGIAAASHIERSVESMLTLNRTACEAMLGLEPHGCTDITGFGLLGHAREMAAGSGVTIEINFDLVQFLPGAVEYAAAGAQPGGLRNNREYVSPCVVLEREIRPEIEALLYDPQTSGGLLVTMPESAAAAFERIYPAAHRVGRVTEKREKPIHLV